MNDFKFTGKYLIKADLRCITGLHIGGTDEGFEIGGIDNPVIKDPITGYPYIPGSSLKGKMRSLLEWADAKIKFGTDDNNNPTGSLCNCGTCDICIIFGCPAETGTKEPTRLTIRDSYPKGLFKDGYTKLEEEQIKEGTIVEWRKNLGEKVYTEVKAENTIDRLTSAANPRSMERVPADSIFEVEIVFDLYNNADTKRLKKVFEGMTLLEDSSLGGGGSRGSGKVIFEGIEISKKCVEDYTKGNDWEGINNSYKKPRDICQNFNNLFK